MSEEKIITVAEFDPKVRHYWLVSGILTLILTIIGIPLILLWIPFGLWITGRFLARMECVLTNKALKVKKGMLVRTEKTIPLEKITDMGMVQGPVMRRYKVHKLTVETAGQSGAGALVSLTGIVDAKQFRETVLKQREVSANRSGEEKGMGSAGGENRDATVQEIRDSLLRIESILSKES